MEAARVVIDAERLMPIIELPESMRKHKVEVIVLPVFESVAARPSGSMKGFLKNYANPDLIDREKGAWESAVVAKHAGP